jgi:hypothetical protein
LYSYFLLPPQSKEDPLHGAGAGGITIKDKVFPAGLGLGLGLGVGSTLKVCTASEVSSNIYVLKTETGVPGPGFTTWQSQKRLHIIIWIYCGLKKDSRGKRNKRRII